MYAMFLLVYRSSYPTHHLDTTYMSIIPAPHAIIPGDVTIDHIFFNVNTEFGQNASTSQSDAMEYAHEDSLDTPQCILTTLTNSSLAITCQYSLLSFTFHFPPVSLQPLSSPHFVIHLLEIIYRTLLRVEFQAKIHHLLSH